MPTSSFSIEKSKPTSVADLVQRILTAAGLKDVQLTGRFMGIPMKYGQQ